MTLMANITRFDPFGEMVSLRSAMDRLFEDSFVNPITWRTLAMVDGVTPRFDVQETDDEISVKAALPGLKARDIEITLTGQDLTLKGEMKADEKVDRDQVIYRERRFGSFRRSLRLPVRVQGDRANAEFSDGVLTLTIPKADEVKPRQIPVGTGGDTSEPIEVNASGEAAAS
jgi:HSP20 family protein